MLEVVSLSARLAFADESVLQLHLGPLRDVSPRLLARVGRDAGGDVIGDEHQAPGLARFLGALERDGTLPRTILYNVNPADNALFASIAGASLQARGHLDRAVGAAVVVQRPRAGAATAARRPLADRPAGRLRRHAHRLALDPLDDASRALPARPLRRDRRRSRRGPYPGRARVVLDGRARPLHRQRSPLLLAASLLGRLMAPRRVVIMGVAGSGKSTVAAALAARRGVRFLEADEFHSAANREKMAAGSPLTDDDRSPWLAALRQAMRGEQEAVVACSALKRAYRDALRAAGEVGFVMLALERAEIVRRLDARRGHFMSTAMVESQFAALQAPTEEERDVVSVDASGETAAVVDRVEAALVGLATGTSTAPLRSLGGPAAAISSDELRKLVDELARSEVLAAGLRRVLLVPPDLTRLHSRAGEITGLLFERLSASGCEVAVLPALGTHAAMTAREAKLLFGERIPFARIRAHRWREGLARVGEIGAEEISALSGGRMATPIAVEVDQLLLDDWDLVVSVGQVVPHEVIGMANFSKNLVIGLGGADTIHRTHFLGAVCDMETIMGRAHSPVRDVVDAAFDRFLSPRIPVLWVLTVTEDTPDGVVHRGLFVGRGSSADSGGAAYEAAADLSARCNIELVPEPLERVSCWLDPDEFTTTWVANKAVYRTRMALADGGELVVLAPGVSRFGEDATIDALIRRHGYRGTATTLAALERDPELAENLGAAAHLIHGSSEARFQIVYCTDPASGGLTREEVEGVGYGWRPLPEELDRLGLTSAAASGPQLDREGARFNHIANPALGLWATRASFADR